MEPKSIVGAIVLAGMGIAWLINFLGGKSSVKFDRSARTTSKGPLDWSKVEKK